jgi:hypothetical protein
MDEDIKVNNMDVQEILVKAPYDHNHLVNQRPGALADQEVNQQWTQRERGIVANAETIKDEADHIAKLADFYPGGAMDPSQPYLRLSTASFPK